MNLAFKERLAFLYLISTAGIILLLFLVIVITVKKSVFQQLDHDIYTEAVKHYGDIRITNGIVSFDKSAWLEPEHRMVEVNPVFVEAVDSKGGIIARSPNLKTDSLRFNPGFSGKFINCTLADNPIRQYQITIEKDGKRYGYLMVAMSLNGAQMVLKKLKTTLWFAFPVVLLVLFLWARFFAGKSIQPVTTIIRTAEKITRNNLGERIPLPPNKDELYHLVNTINRLLDRIEQAVEREKQFTSDAAHELKTPLQVMKGNMGILIRKPRDEKEYREEIRHCLSETDRMAHLVDQLLLLARFESQKKALDIRPVALDDLVDQVIRKKLWQIEEKKLNLKLDIGELISVNSDPYFLHIRWENLFSNTVKYTPVQGKVVLSIGNENNYPYLSIRDNGPGIKPEEKEKIFNRFYRSGSTEYPDIKGTGLGLSIVKRLCEILQLDLLIESETGKGFFVKLLFTQK